MSASASHLSALTLFVIAIIATDPLKADESAWLPTNQTITPTSAQGSVEMPVVAGQGDHRRALGQITRAMISRDGSELIALSSGFNRYANPQGQSDPNRSDEAVLIYSLTEAQPTLSQTLEIPNTFNGLTQSEDGQHLWVSGGKDDVLYGFHRSERRWVADDAPIPLHSGRSVSLDIALNNDGVGALAAGIALYDHDQKAIVSLYEHDAVALVDLKTRQLLSQFDLRPGKRDAAQSGVPGGEFPLDVVTVNQQRAFIASVRDREIVVLDLLPTAHVVKRIALPGQPTRLITDRNQTRLWASVANADQILAWDTRTLKPLLHASTRLAPMLGLGDGKPGANPNNLTLSTDEKTLYVSNAADNAVVGFHIDWKDQELEPLGAIPTGWYPSAMASDPVRQTLYVFNAKSPSGANPLNCKFVSPGPARASGCDPNRPSRSGNDYVLQLIHSSLLTIPIPTHREWQRLTQVVAANNGVHRIITADEKKTIEFLQHHIQHVIYVVRENRTFDQILGDLPGVNGDPTRAQFPLAVTPNAHRLASQFSALDHYFCSGDVSMNGWQWSTAARVSDINEKMAFVNYARRGGSYDSEGGTRNVNVAIGDGAQRAHANPLLQSITDPDFLPGARNPVELDGDLGQPGAGYVWSAALRAHLSVRNYGFFIDLTRYDSGLEKTHPEAWIKPTKDPRAQQLVVSYPTHEELIGRTDPYFYSFDTKVPDYYRVQEWMTEFSEFEKNEQLPNLSLVRLMMDHTGTFKETLDHVNTPELQIADNDYALGLLIERVAHSRYASNTLIVVTEDDAQDGPDHLDAHRSPAFIIGPYTQQNGKVISTAFTTVNLIKTIEVVLGLQPLGARDEHASPMLEVFDVNKPHWTYQAVPSELLRLTQLPLPSQPDHAATVALKPLHDVNWWQERTKDYDFSAEDKLDAAAYNLLLWQGTMGDQPYPTRSVTQSDSPDR